jgi:phosphoribosyl-ATP pyrophosphohydrolase
MTNQSDPALVVDRLYAVIDARRRDRPKGSYTTKLFKKGTAKIAQKVGEEAVETVIAAMRKDNAELVEESADLLYHLLVLWADAGLRPEQVWQELERREQHSVVDDKKKNLPKQ